jgi:uncharacterized membrane protein
MKAIKRTIAMVSLVAVLGAVNAQALGKKEQNLLVGAAVAGLVLPALLLSSATEPARHVEPERHDKQNVRYVEPERHDKEPARHVQQPVKHNPPKVVTKNNNQQKVVIKNNNNRAQNNNQPKVILKGNDNQHKGR